MIRLVLVDDHRLFRVGLRRMLDELKGIQIVGEAEDGEAGVQLARELRPDVILMDLMMPGIGGLEATRRVDQLELGARVVVLSASDQAPFPLQALRAGAVGYVTKGASAAELGTAIKRAFVGKRYLSADVAQALAVSSFEDEGSGPFDQLSNREMQIMMMVVNCHRVNDISNSLHLSPKTVNSYRYRIFEKLNVRSDVELALMAVRHGMVQAPRLETAPAVAEPVG
ncbi:MAG: DNA-binding response regulator [Gammaproteobacteria bacterium]|jgi:DNA-binding NarL/FixJ family response regulator|nr:DNA-binding response regulator [Gammaproteobacteria bacterium]|tara:strand:+ start:7252 stop:7929 length:678 start_codon:yes stop_codon:yes gene_type:complete